MTISKHPTDETLAAFAAGQLDEGRRVVVEAHAELCATCSGWVARRGIHFCIDSRMFANQMKHEIKYTIL